MEKPTKIYVIFLFLYVNMLFSAVNSFIGTKATPILYNAHPSKTVLLVKILTIKFHPPQPQPLKTPTKATRKPPKNNHTQPKTPPNFFHNPK